MKRFICLTVCILIAYHYSLGAMLYTALHPVSLVFSMGGHFMHISASNVPIAQKNTPRCVLWFIECVDMFLWTNTDMVLLVCQYCTVAWEVIIFSNIKWGIISFCEQTSRDVTKFSLCTPLCRVITNICDWCVKRNVKSVATGFYWWIDTIFGFVFSLSVCLPSSRISWNPWITLFAALNYYRKLFFHWSKINWTRSTFER